MVRLCVPIVEVILAYLVIISGNVAGIHLLVDIDIAWRYIRSLTDEGRRCLLLEQSLLLGRQRRVVFVEHCRLLFILELAHLLPM